MVTEQLGEGWMAVAARLPVEMTSEDKMARAELFSLWDPNGNGFLSLAEIDRGVSITPGLGELYKCKPALIRAFNASKNLKPGDSSKKGLQDDDYVSRIEFRMLLVYMKLFFGVFMIFDRIDTGQDRRVDIDEFRTAADDLRILGCPIAENPDETFRVIDKDGGGQILFVEFCEWAVDNHVLLNPETEGKAVRSSQPQGGAATVPQVEVPELAAVAEEDKPLQGLMTNVWGQVRSLNSELSEMRQKVLEAMEKRNKAKARSGFTLAPANLPRVASLPAKFSSSAPSLLPPTRRPVLEDDDDTMSVKSGMSGSTMASRASVPKTFAPRDKDTFQRLTRDFKWRQSQPDGASIAEPTPPPPTAKSEGAKRLAEKLWGNVRSRHLARSKSYGALDRSALTSASSQSSVSSSWSVASDPLRVPNGQFSGKGAAERAKLRAEQIKHLEQVDAMEVGRGLRTDVRDKVARAQATLEFRGERVFERQAFRPQPVSGGIPFEWGS